jgi:hypothetical protein
MNWISERRLKPEAPLFRCAGRLASGLLFESNKIVRLDE